jgi:hypothetical protein
MTSTGAGVTARSRHNPGDYVFVTGLSTLDARLTLIPILRVRTLTTYAITAHQPLTGHVSTYVKRNPGPSHPGQIRVVLDAIQHVRRGTALAETVHSVANVVLSPWS